MLSTIPMLSIVIMPSIAVSIIASNKRAESKLSPLLHYFFILHAFRLYITQTFFLVFFVFRIVTLEEIHLRITLKRQNMGTNPIQKPAVVKDNHGTTTKVF